MHSVSHTFAHRAPPVARTRARWQPYGSFSAPSRSPTYLVTPSTVSTSPPSSSVFETDRFPSANSPALSQIRDLQKARYVISLVDQAVKCLCEIWNPSDVPIVFLTSSRANVTLSAPKEVAPSATIPVRDGIRIPYLPSPLTPNTRPSPPPLLSTSPVSQPSDAQAALDARSNLVPLKGFVHEVLRRSRTSGTVLQTALCYLEAIRRKVPDLVELENSGQGVRGEPEQEGRIVEEIDEEADFGFTFEAMINLDKCDQNSPLPQAEVEMDSGDSQDRSLVSSSDGSSTSDSCRALAASKKHKTPSPPLAPLPRLPSPLLCPRRTFLASLILASKFTQDRCYSNRAWAKLSGLPPREIGRCERALGDALQWRLWVGKKTSAPVTNNRPVVRCRSESDLHPAAAKAASMANWNFQRPMESRPAANRALRRWSTLPSDAFGSGLRTTGGAERPTLGASVGVVADVRTRRAADGDEGGSSTWKWASPPGHPVTSPLDPTMKNPWTQNTLRISNKVSPIEGTCSDHIATPPLYDSPESTESDSSNGDRTIQMSVFIDVPSPPPPPSKPMMMPFVAFGDYVTQHAGVMPGFAPHIAEDSSFVDAPFNQMPFVALASDAFSSAVDAVQLY